MCSDQPMRAPWVLESLTDGRFERRLVVVEVKSLTAVELRRAIKVWAQVLPTARTTVLKHQAFEGSDPWFGFGVKHRGKVFDEQQTLAKVKDARVAATLEAFVEALIAFNRRHRSLLEGGLATHEELETGTFAVEWLVRHRLAWLPLYLRFLKTLDLEHTVEQVNLVLRLARQYRPEQLRPLAAWCLKHQAARLSDWLVDDRAWAKPPRTPAPNRPKLPTRNLAGQPLYARGLRHLQAGDLKEARACADRALAVAPDDIDVVYLDVRLAWKEAGDPAAALVRARQRLAAIDTSLQRDESARFFNLLGCACDELKQWPEAKSWFEKAAALAPAEHIYATNLAELHEKLGERAQARQAAAKAKKLGSSATVVLRLLKRQ